MPLFRHDCDHCEFLGTYHGMDHYRCRAMGTAPLGDTLIARRSDKGSDYSSLCDFKNRVQRAVAHDTGGLTQDQIAVIALWRMLPSLILNGRRVEPTPEP